LNQRERENQVIRHCQLWKTLSFRLFCCWTYFCVSTTIWASFCLRLVDGVSKLPRN